MAKFIKANLKNENMHDKVSARHTLVKYFIIYLIIFFFIPIFNAYILLIAFNPNIKEEIYEKDYSVGKGYLIFKFFAKNEENERFSYSYVFKLKSTGDVEDINFTNINIRFYWNKYNIRTFQKSFEYGSQVIGGGGSRSYSKLEFHDNFTIIGSIKVELNVQGDYQNEIFNLNTKYEFLEPTWFQRYGVFIIIMIQVSLFSIFVSVIYLVHKRKVAKNDRY